MTLQELLKSFNLTDEQIRNVNSSVDVLIETRNNENQNVIKKLNDDIKKINDELTPFKINDKKEKSYEIVKDLISKDKYDAAYKLAEISNEDTNEVIKSKISKTIETYAFLKSEQGDNKIVGKIENKELPKNEEATKEQEIFYNSISKVAA